ncbi:MAG TPA: segregation/condensation protein A [Fibrobacteraceae bacterium]|jgi:chromatin segregation and condensation protein Rec8/ScpA/Scc1 (kleisin family)|nr:segregation/condensation protein A [Fibrobacter sp.]HOG68523.1 segregation/condensation protein A [Fibrobacteraceae bacterium]HPW94598.1 segregation/condensation protein A [Fibrobacteraceae bacterium]
MVISEKEDYEVRIGAFEGPMDLLLYLVQKNEVNPGEISIAEITDQYLFWIKDLAQADLSAAGDFLLMASRLMALKVRELLPKEAQSEEELLEFSEDREQLLREMLEYQRYKQVAKELQEKEFENFGTFYRGRLERSHNEEETLADANIWQLFRAYQKSLKARNAESIHHIELDYVTIEDRQQVISNYLAAHGRALFEDLLGRDQHPIVAAVTFMALMEMIKTDEVVFRQGEPFGPIWLYRKKNNLDYADEMANETVILSKDPEFKPGLIDALRERESSLAQNKAATIDAVMREAVLWASQGKMIQEDDLIAMLEGRISLSETNETPTEIQNDSSAEASPAAENKILAENASIEEINPTERLEEDL